MKYANHKVSGIRLAYIGGGSRGWAWKFMADLAMEPSLSGEVALYDIDRPAAEANEIIGNKIDAMPAAAGRWHYSVANTLQEALTGGTEKELYPRNCVSLLGFDIKIPLFTDKL